MLRATGNCNSIKHENLWTGRWSLGVLIEEQRDWEGKGKKGCDNVQVAADWNSDSATLRVSEWIQWGSGVSCLRGEEAEVLIYLFTLVSDEAAPEDINSVALPSVQRVRQICFMHLKNMLRLESRGMSGDCNGLFTSSAIAVVIQSLSPVWLSATPWTAAHRLPCSSSPPRVCSNSSPLDPWGHSVISSSVAPFISCPQSFLCYGLLHTLRRFTHVAGQVHSVFSLIFFLDHLL